MVVSTRRSILGTMAVNADGRTTLVRGSWFTRLGGPYMCLIAVAGLFVIMIADPAAGLFVVPLWAAPAFWWGARLARLGVLADASGLIVRNPLRTYTVDWSGIVDVRLERRRATPWERLTLFFLQFDRWVGVIEVSDRPEPIQMYATESFWFAFYGRIFSQRRETAASKVDAVRSAWRAAA